MEAAASAPWSEADCRRLLLAGLIDHAPMFPPASLPLEQALAADAAAASGPYAWMLGRLVVPASALAQLPTVRRPLSVVLDAPLPAGTSPAAIELTLDGSVSAPEGIAEVYQEIDLDADLEAQLARLAAGGLRAKIRCGGARTPSLAILAAFVRAARRHGLPFKATAGLHHPLRRGAEHGFLNLAAAVAFAGAEEAALAETSAAALRLGPDGLRWRDRHAGPAELERLRSFGLVAIGSCSFTDPVEGLRELDVLP